MFDLEFFSICKKKSIFLTVLDEMLKFFDKETLKNRLFRINSTKDLFIRCNTRLAIRLFLKEFYKKYSLTLDIQEMKQYNTMLY